MPECNVFKCVRIRPLELKSFISPQYSFSRAEIVQASHQHPTFFNTGLEHASLNRWRTFIWDYTAIQCLAIFWLIHHIVLKVTKYILAADWSVEIEWNHSQPLYAISKADTGLHLWLLLICPRCKWMTPKVGCKKKPTMYFIPDPIGNSNLNMTKAQVLWPAEWLTPFQPPGCPHFHCTLCTCLPQHFKTALPWLKKMPLPLLQGHCPNLWLWKVVPG